MFWTQAESGNDEGLVPLHVQLDTGAECTCIGLEPLKKIKHLFRWESRNIRCAAGKRLGVFDNFNRNKVASFAIVINNKRVWIEGAVVIENLQGLLMGLPHLKGKTIVNLVEKSVTFNDAGKVFYGTEEVWKIGEADELDKTKFEPDSRKIYKAKIEKMRQKAENSTTVDDITMGDVGEASAKRLWSVFKSDEYAVVFKKRIGCLNKNFNINAEMNVEIKEENIGPRRKHEKQSEEKKDVICDHLDELYRDKILVFPDEYGIRPRNIIPLMVVSKKDDDGNAIPLAQSARIVTQAHNTVNKWSKTPPMVTDDLHDILQKAAKASKFKYSMKCDVSNAFFQLPMNQDLWKWFGVYHPRQGVMVYTRCTQGWIASMGFMREAFLRIFSPIEKWCLRYADDIHLVAETEDEFVKVISRFLDICKYYGLTLKGSKIFVCPERMNFLGSVIKDGKIYPSPHQADKIRQYSREKITTVSELRSFLGLLVPLSKFQNRPTEYLVPLRKLLDGDGKVKINWTEESEEALELAKKSMDKLMELTPFDAKKKAYIVVDSSADGCGAILFQKDENGKNVVCEFYSRKRPDAERKFKASSCMLETAGMIGALTYWRRYIIESKWPTVVYTDSRPLYCIAKRWAENRCPSDIVTINNLFRSIIGLQVTVVHLPGKSIEISGCDFISRSKSHMQDCNDDCQICKIARTPSSNEVPFVSEKQLEEIDTQVSKLKNYQAVRRIQVHQFDESMKDVAWNMTDSWVDEVDYEKEAFEKVCYVTSKRKPRSLEEFLKDGGAIRKIQETDPVLKQALRHIEKKLNPPPKKMKLATLCRKARIVNNHLRMKKWIGTEEYDLVIIPEPHAVKMCRMVHNATTCQSPTQLADKTRKIFEISNIKTHALRFTTSCYKCSLMKKPDNLVAQPLKAVPVPKRIGELILVDEINRTDRNNQPFKLYFATEGITRFGVALADRSSVNTGNFVDFMTLVKQLLAPLQSKSTRIIIRCDKHAAHRSAETKSRLAKLNMEVELYESTHMSKNIIPEQDGRIAVLSKLLNAQLNDRSLELPQAVQNAIASYNHTLGHGKLAPVELFTGDIIRLSTRWDKQDYDRLWKVVEINWKSRTCLARKFNAKNDVKPREISFDIIDTIVSDTVRKVSDNLLSNPMARLWLMQPEDVSVWEEADENHLGPRAHRIDLLDDSAISLGPKSTLPPTPAPEIEVSPKQSTPSKTLKSSFGLWCSNNIVSRLLTTGDTGVWTASPETDLNETDETVQNNESSEDCSFHSVASSSALNESDLDKLKIRTSSRTRREPDRYRSEDYM
ncbi:Oidioi.mRNA.OKI2018_I69.PAR.g8583.t1.cds [Oikopleura dioica]|uniref:ribonuclease H n=1 Tax=Oikopleura dioica TaxID=34765 RepID=A0ABN7RGK8_OIKDI|nr:Oidioi.mRNA.OKI2018_I69.PAR.g8583.t1.cds [Oikopleura dioica]